MIDNNSIVDQRYAELRPKRFVDLCESIQQLYNGEWVIMGNSPEEGTYNPNPKDQERARKMWRNTYQLLKPYEKMIYEDFQDMEYGNPLAYQDGEKQVIWAMHQLCECYHNNVELWDEVQVGVSGPTIPDAEKAKMVDSKKEEAKPKKSESPLERMKKAHAYLLETHTYFAETRLPKLEKDLKTFISKVPEEKKVEMLKKRKETLKNNLCGSNFFCKCPQWMPVEEEYMIDQAFSPDEDGPILHSTYSSYALKTFFDGAGVLDEDKLALYIYDNQEEVKLTDVQKFFAYIDLTKVINDMLPFDENNIMLAELPVKEPEPNPFEDSAPAEPDEVEYSVSKARAYFKSINEKFAKESLPLLKERLQEWCSKFPIGKRKEAIEAKRRSFMDELQRSNFFKYYGAEVPMGFYENVACCADSQYELDRMCADEQFACDLDDLYDGLDVLNEEKLRRYIWVNQKRLNEGQIDAMLTYDEACKILPTLMPTDMEVMAEAMTELENNGPMMPFDDDPTAEELISINTIYTDKIRKKSVYDAYCKVMKDTIIPKVLSKVSGQKRSEKWRWPHVYDALKDARLGYIGKDAGVTDFGHAMKELDSTLKPANVTQRLKDKSKDYPTTADKNIIADIINTLK